MNYYLGGDVSKGYCDFVILDKNKNIIEEGFQLDATKESQNIIKNTLYNKGKSRSNNKEREKICSFRK